MSARYLLVQPRLVGLTLVLGTFRARWSHSRRASKVITLSCRAKGRFSGLGVTLGVGCTVIRVGRAIHEQRLTGDLL